jgi:DNA-directed RNA polymerase specialized sigma subunit
MSATLSPGEYELDEDGLFMHDLDRTLRARADRARARALQVATMLSTKHTAAEIRAELALTREEYAQVRAELTGAITELRA